MQGRKRLLVVDDDIDFADSLAELLTAEGFDVSIAYDGVQALRLMRDEPFDLTIIDVQMPGKNGVESLVEIRALQPSARVVMMTGYSVPAVLDSAIAAGAHAIVYKPFGFEQLSALMDDAVRIPVALVADDDADFVASLRGLLESGGYAVMAASDGEEVLDLATRRTPDVLLLDLRLPGMSGIETYRELERRHQLPPTIVVSAYLDEDRDALQALPRLSAERIMAKPIDPGRLIELLDHATEAR